METLQDMFAATNTIGDKYLTAEEKAKRDAAYNAVMADIIKEAVARGEYDQEKGQWLI